MFIRHFGAFVGFVTVIFASLWLTSTFPPSVFLLLAFWSIAVFLDIHSTWQIYQLKPGEFSKIESNIFFVILHERIGFKRSIPVFLILIEVPRFLFIAFFLAPLTGGLLLLNISYFTGLGSAAAIHGYAHIHGWRVNRSFLFLKSPSYCEGLPASATKLAGTVEVLSS